MSYDRVYADREELSSRARRDLSQKSFLGCLSLSHIFSFASRQGNSWMAFGETTDCSTIQNRRENDKYHNLQAQSASKYPDRFCKGPLKVS